MRRDHWLREIERLDPVTDHVRIYRIMTTLEFPWDMNQALSFALYRTYAVPSIGVLLQRTGELTHRTQKRYDDTVLLLDAMLADGLDSHRGRTALRRMNHMHGMYDIGNDDLRYVLCTFVTVPERWMDAYGWRPFSETERVAAAEYYRHLGRHMGIRDVPATHEEFAQTLDDYEADHFAPDPRAREVSEATLSLMQTFPPFHLLPAGASRRAALALMDGPLLDAFGYPHPSRLERAVVRGGLRARGHVVKRMRPRRDPATIEEVANVRSYPDGYDVAELGTFRRGFPADG
jgi:hypothetical protein